MSLADEIAKLTNPAPELEDPEDEANIESIARLSERFEESDTFESGHKFNTLRTKNAPLLEELDNRYAGKRVSRKSFDPSFESADMESASEDESAEEDSEEEIDDDMVSSFKKKFNVKSSIQKRDSDVHSESESSHGEFDVNDDVEEDEESDEDEEKSDKEDEEENDEDEEESEEEDIIQRFSSFDMVEEIEKGKAVQKQQELWNKLCECRIKMQKLLLSANELPQHDRWDDFKKLSSDSYSEDLHKGYKSVEKLLSNLISLETELSRLMAASSAKHFDSGKVAEDEEIPSESDAEGDDEKEGSGIQEEEMPTSSVKSKTKKRKMNFEEYEGCLLKRHQSFAPVRNEIIQKWDDKTSLTTGRMTQKSFTAFNQTAVKQINQILMDKPRLIKRTQLKRSAYRVLGKQDLAETTNEVEHDDHLKNYDPEIFDDDDFYRQLLKDIIETKSVGLDPLVLSKQLEIQRIRSKMKRKVDTKASKGRKIRYDVHPKMVNYMAPLNTLTMTEEARDELFKSLFGQNLPSSIN